MAKLSRKQRFIRAEMTRRIPKGTHPEDAQIIMTDIADEARRRF